MKCRAKVIYYQKKNKNGSKRIAMTLKPNMSDDEIAWTLDHANKKTLELTARNGLMYECQGKIIMEVSAEDEPYMGGSSAVLAVRYKCDTCGHAYYPQLPDSHNLDEWLNNILSNME